MTMCTDIRTIKDLGDFADFVKWCRAHGLEVIDHPYIPLDICTEYGGQSERGFPAVYINGREYDANTPAELLRTEEDEDYRYRLVKTNRPDPDPEVIRFRIIPLKGILLEDLPRYASAK